MGVQADDDAVALVQQAYDQVNELTKSFVPKSRPVAPVPAGLTARATTEPKTLREAISGALTRSS